MEGTRTRGYLVLIVFGLVVLLIGVGALAAAALVPQVTTTTFTLPPGQTYCTRFRFDTLTSGSVTVSFQVSPGSVNEYVMTEAQHTAFVSGAGLSYLASDTAPSGTFSASLPSGGTYFIESCHESSSAGLTQIGSHTMTVNAVSTGPFVVGVGAIVVAAILLGIGAWLRTRPPRPSVPPMPMYPYAPGAPYGGPAFPPMQGPPGAWVPGPPPIAPPGYPPSFFGVIVVTVENRSATDETVQLLVGGMPAATLSVPAGQTATTSIRQALPSPYGANVVVEAVAADGRRSSQSAFVGIQTPTSLSIRIG